MTDNSTPGFYVVFLGQIEGCKMDGVDNLYCKYSFNYGLDWSTSHGLEHGIRWVVALIAPRRASAQAHLGERAFSLFVPPPAKHPSPLAKSPRRGTARTSRSSRGTTPSR